MTTQPVIIFITWRHRYESGGQRKSHVYVIGRLIRHVTDVDVEYEFAYVRQANEAREKGMPQLMEFDEMDKVYRSPVPFPTFDNRMMSPRRPDYASFLRELALKKEEGPDPLHVLIRSEGKKATDHYEVFGWPSYQSDTGRYVIHFWLRGIEHQDKGWEERVGQLRLGDAFDARVEDVDTDPQAVGLYANGYRLGFAARYVSPEYRELLSRGVNPVVEVAHINSEHAPTSMRILCRMSANWPAGFIPFNQPELQPISPDAIVVPQAFDPKTLEPLHRQHNARDTHTFQ